MEGDRLVVCYNQRINSVQIVHIPTQTASISTCERSQYRNRNIALQVLKSKLFAQKIGIKHPEFPPTDLTNTLCYFCEMGYIYEEVEYIVRSCYGEDFRIPKVFWKCFNCGEEFVTDDQTKQNSAWENEARTIAYKLFDTKNKKRKEC